MPLRMNDEPRVESQAGLETCCCVGGGVGRWGPSGQRAAVQNGLRGVERGGECLLPGQMPFLCVLPSTCIYTVSVGEATICRCSLDGPSVSCCVAGPQTCQRGATVQVTRRRRRSRGEPRSHSSRLCFRSQRVRASAVLGSALILARVPVGRGACLGHGVGPSGSSRTCLIAVARQQRGKRWRGKGET